MQTEIHPEALARLGLLTVRQATRYLRGTRKFNELEIYNLVEKAGCIQANEDWTPYTPIVRLPFLLCEETPIQ